MGLTANVATAIAATVAGAAGMRGCAPADVDSVPATPYGVVGLPRVSVSPGSWETVDYAWPVRVFVARVSDGPRVTTTAYDLFDAIVTAFRSGIQQGLALSGVSETLISDVEFDAFWTVAGEDYQGLAMTITTHVARGATYTA